MELHPKQTLLRVLPLLLVLIGLMAAGSNDAMATENPSQGIYSSSLYKTDPEVDLFINPGGYFSVYGVELQRLEDEVSGEPIIRAEIPLFNGGKDIVTIPKGTRILTFSHKGEPPSKTKKFVNVVTEKKLQIAGRSNEWPSYRIFTVDFDNEFLKSGLNELVYTVDPDNAIAEATYLVFEAYQMMLSMHEGDIRDYEASATYLSLQEMVQFEKDYPDIDIECTVASTVYVSEGKSIIPVKKYKLECENGLNPIIHQELKIGMKVFIKSGFTVDAEGFLVQAPDLSGTVKVWDPGYYIFGETNNQGGYGADKTPTTLKLYSPDSHPDLIVTSVRTEPDSIFLFGNFTGEYNLIIEGLNAGADMTHGVVIQPCIKDTLRFAPTHFEPVKSGESFEYKIAMSLMGEVAGPGDKLQIQVRVASDNANTTFSYRHNYFWKKSGTAGWSNFYYNTSSGNLGSPPSGGFNGALVWDFLLNNPTNGGFPQYKTPLEVGSDEGVLIRYREGLGKGCYDSNWEPPHGNGGEATILVSKPKPFLLPLDSGHVWEQGIYPPLLDREYIREDIRNSAGDDIDVYTLYTVKAQCDEDYPTRNRTVEGAHTTNQGPPRSLEMWSYDCWGQGQDFFDSTIWGTTNWFTSTMLVDKEFQVTQEWIDGWRDSIVRFRWIPADDYGIPTYQVQIHDDAQTLIYETTFETTLKAGASEAHTTGTKYDIGKYDEYIEEYYSNAGLPEGLANDLIKGSKAGGFFEQWVYDGPPLAGGAYTFRVAYGGFAEEGTPWSAELPFVIETEDMAPGDSIALRDTELDQEIRFVGTITGIALDGITVTIEAGTTVHLNIDADTLISTEATGLEGHLIPGLKVEVTVPEVPYIAERAYIPLNRIPTASSITDFITPELIYPGNGQVFDLGVYPPIQDDWASCSSQECDQAKLLTSPSLDPWKAGWVNSLLRFRWLPTLTTENARFQLEIQNDSGTVVYESDFVPSLSEEGLNSTSTGVAVDETTWLGTDPTSARHYHQIVDHYWIDRRSINLKGGDTTKAVASEGKFYQYVYDGPVLMPGEYTWKVARIPDTAGEPALWSSESTFVVKAAPTEPGSPDQLEQSSGKEKVVFKGKVTKITPGGFIVATKSGLVHVRTDADTTIFSPLTHFHEEVPLDWKVIVLGEVEPYILDKPYTPADGNIFSGKVTDIRPGGFSVATSAGLVHMQSDANTVIHSAETGLHQEAPVGWNVHFISQAAPYLSGRAYVPNVQIPLATNVIEQMPTATDVTEHISNRAHKRCTALGPTDTGTTAFSCDDGDYVELNTTDIPNGSSAVVLVQHNPETVNCTVVANPSPTSSILKCEDGNNKIIESYLAVGTVVQSQNDAAKLVSTASSLYSRMERFKSEAAALNDPSLLAELSDLQDDATVGFKEAYEQAMANASPQVLALMDLMGTLSNKISGLAQSFISGDGQLIFDDHDIQQLADQLRQFAANYDSMVDIIVIETLADHPQSEQDAATANIKYGSGTFLSGVKSDLEKAAQFLDQGNIPDALALLDKVTSEEEVWLQQTVKAYLNIVLAQKALDEAVAELTEYGDMLSETAKESLQSRINDLYSNLSIELQQPGTVDLMAYVEALWDEMAQAWNKDAMGETNLLELKGKAESLIDDAKEELKDYAEYIEQTAKDEIEAKILSLEGVIDEEDEELIQSAIDDLMNALASSGSGSEVEEASQESIVKRAQDLILQAETDLVDYAEYIEQPIKNEIETKVLALNQVLESDDPDVIQEAIDALIVALSKFESTSEEESQGTDLTAAINQALGIADEIIADFEDEMDPAIMNDLKQKTNLLRSALTGTDEDLISAAFNSLTLLLGELKDSTPDKQGGITIECPSQVLVGKPFECSFSHTMMPDHVTWTAPGGSPSSGSGDTFETSFATTGASSISIEACIGDDCVNDSQTVTVVEALPSDEPSEEQAEAQLNITIECGSPIPVGIVLECSSNYTMMPDQITWAAPGGTPASGTGDWFQTTFATAGQFSISIEACIGSNCVADSAVITVIEDNPQEQPSDDEPTEEHGSQEDGPQEMAPDNQPSEEHSSPQTDPQDESSGDQSAED